MYKCTLSTFCKKHNQDIKKVFNINIITGFAKVKLTSNDNDVKEMLCRIINDRAINKICECDGLLIDVLEEICFDKKNNILGTNQDYNRKIQLVIKYDGKLLKYNELIGILIHELAHTKYRDHGSDFIAYEKSLRSKYVAYLEEFHMIKPWDPKFEFCTALGSHTQIKSIDSTSTNTIIIFVIMVCVVYLLKIYRQQIMLYLSNMY